MTNADVLLISDPGYEGVSLLFNLASQYSSNIVWIAAEPPAIIESIVSAYEFKGRLNVVTPKQWRGYNFVNIMNLNEVSIAISKAGEEFKEFSLIITLIPELLLIHGLEKTYLFMLNTIWKIHNQGGITFALLTKGAQSVRDEIMMERPFACVLRLNKTLADSGWIRKLVIETPISTISQEIYEIQVSGFRVDMPEEIKEGLIQALKVRNH
ncbi:hypothetical protein [Archaeoglobus veneficus]|uniref:KaiC-like domain-containing protein n=1 Tax=Archaeoglobus veneficus (strain DSM 11195 / SNP6) TaxID=693661 RepID=F2KNX7_ARCVS|nr:hypothetical protein [Archaeoglobus veneficus]AEA47454.1 hypothetical protein Arcve_1451 [Archaeoglobus veneficus SNP6]